MLSRENFFYRLCALRIAKVLDGREATYGTYRQFVRQHASDFGDPSLGEKSDETIFGALAVLWKESCLELTKLSLQDFGLHDFSEFGNSWNGIWKLIGQNGFRIKLKPEGQEMLNEMEAAIVAPPSITRRTIGFSPSRRSE